VTFNYNPVGGLQLAAEVVYANSRFTENFQNLTLGGDRLTRAPKWTGRISADYETPIRDGVVGFLGAGVDFSSKTYFQFPRAQPLAPTPIGRVPGRKVSLTA
jgi:hypothetical protein